MEKKIMSCQFNMDTGCVEVKYADGCMNRLDKVKDASGAEVSNNYDNANANAQMLALSTRITDQAGTVTSTSYDTHYRVTQSSVANCATLSYTYTKGNLTKVSLIVG